MLIFFTAAQVYCSLWQRLHQAGCCHQAPLRAAVGRSVLRRDLQIQQAAQCKAFSLLHCKFCSRWQRPKLGDLQK